MPAVVTVGRLVPEKNAMGLLAAFQLVAAMLPQVQLKIIGDGPMRGHLEQRVETMPNGVRERIKFYGHVPYPQRLLNSATVFVSLSTAESFGLVAMEAALAGAPLVLSKIRPWTDYFDDSDECLFVDSSKPAEVAEEIVKLLISPDYRAEMASRGKAKATLVSSEAAIGAAWKDFYTGLLQG